jgi:hypothetical protein
MSGGPLRPEDLHKIAEDVEMAKLREAMASTRKVEEEANELRQAFIDAELRPNVMDLLNTAVRRTAEQNKNELMVMSFPADYCTDKGRRINNADADWPESLQGRAKRGYDFYQQNLKALGYKLYARVLDYPGGMPGTVGFFLKW